MAVVVDVAVVVGGGGVPGVAMDEEAMVGWLQGLLWVNVLVTVSGDVRQWRWKELRKHQTKEKEKNNKNK